MYLTLSSQLPTYVFIIALFCTHLFTPRFHCSNGVSPVHHPVSPNMHTLNSLYITASAS